MKRLLPLGMALTCAMLVPQAWGNNCDQRPACLERCAKELAEREDTDYICQGENKNCKNRCEGNHEARISRRGKKISDYARDCIWANYPEMQGAIDLINDKVFSGLIDYAMYPNQGYSSPRGIPTSIEKIPRTDMGTAHYWLLLKIYDIGYNYLADETGDPGAGVPPPPYPPSPVWFFAKGLRKNNPDSESDLLKALYIAALGDPKWAEPVINGTFMDVPGVREKVTEWKEKHNFAPYSHEMNHFLAYNLNLLRKADFRDKELVELSLLALRDLFNNGHEKENVYSRIVEDCADRGKLAGYIIITRDGSSWTTTYPVTRIFRQR